MDAGEPPSPAAPSARALGKRKMSRKQLKDYYAKLPRTAPDSDDEAPKEPLRSWEIQAIEQNEAAPIGAPIHLPPLTGDFGFNPGNGINNENTHPDTPTRARAQRALNVSSGRYSPVNLSNEWTQDISEALFGRESPAAADAASETNGLTQQEIEELDGIYDETPDSAVQDPFSPDLQCTAAERDSLLHEEQAYRRSVGMALLVRNPVDRDHWIEEVEAEEVYARACITPVPVQSPGGGAAVVHEITVKIEEDQEISMC